MPPEAQQLIAGKYRLQSPLARGGMGSVWIARHVELEVEVAIKFRTAEHGLDTKAELRFKREAQAAAQLKSPHVVQIHDYGINDGTPYIAMELLDGEDLSALLEREPRLSLKRALDLLRQVGKALTRAHTNGIVHRDIKPSNLFLASHGDEEILKVLDFGIAKEQNFDRGDATTSIGVILGSPTYMSPEQGRGSAVDQRSDVYSLAAVLFRMLTGVPPFTGENSQDVIIKICSETPPAASLYRADFSRDIDAFFARALARKPEARFQSVAELVRAFEAVVEKARDPLQVPVGNPKVLGRTSDTQSLVTPIVETTTSGPRQRIILVGAALLTVLALLWLSTKKATKQATAQQTNAPLAAPEAAPTMSATSMPVMPAPAHAIVSTPPSTVNVEKPQPLATGRPAKAATSVKPRTSVTDQVVDPVFGIAVPHETKKPE